MANFLDATAEIELRLSDYAVRLARIDAHVRRGDQRAARGELHGFLEELIDFSDELKLPLETVVVGAQLGFFSGGRILRGRLPGAVLGAAAGWLYGQQVMQRHRRAVEQLAEKVALITVILDRDTPQAIADSIKATNTEELPRSVVVPATERVTLEVDRKPPA